VEPDAEANGHGAPAKTGFPLPGFSTVIKKQGKEKKKDQEYLLPGEMGGIDELNIRREEKREAGDQPGVKHRPAGAGPEIQYPVQQEKRCRSGEEGRKAYGKGTVTEDKDEGDLEKME
jgi:hypothetical protein